MPSGRENRVPAGYDLKRAGASSGGKASTSGISGGVSGGLSGDPGKDMARQLRKAGSKKEKLHGRENSYFLRRGKTSV